MYLRNKSQYNQEQLEALKIMWLQQKEDKVRARRKLEKIDVNLTERQVWQLEWDLRDRPLSPEEQKEMLAFEKMMLVEMSFGHNLENSDIV